METIPHQIKRFASYLGVFIVIGRVCAGVRKLHVPHDAAELIVCVAALGIVLYLVRASTMNPDRRTGFWGNLLGRGARIGAGVAWWEWLVLLAITLGWRFVKSPTTPDISLMLTTAWVVNWLVIFPTQKAESGKGEGGGRRVGPSGFTPASD